MIQSANPVTGNLPETVTPKQAGQKLSIDAVSSVFETSLLPKPHKLLGFAAQ
jgi:hypothetical protein